MLCEKCHHNAATVHMTQVINGVKEEIHICEECARNGNFISPISFQDFFQGMFDLNTMAKDEKKDVSCPACQMTYRDFRKTSLLGCSECYDFFRKQMNEVIRNIHGGNEHSGKFPQKTGGQLLLKKQKDRLKKQLEKAIENEQYEEAAKIRDSIRNLCIE